MNRVTRQVLLGFTLLWISASVFTAQDQAVSSPANLQGKDAIEPIRIGSKAFTESYILAELAAQLLEHHGFAVERKLGLGGTLIAFQALQENAIDLYPEYTGTLTQAILKQPGLSDSQLADALRGLNLQLLGQLGFNNTYAIAIANEQARQRDIHSISDLRDHPDLKLGFSLEFLNRQDGWLALKNAYGLPHDAIGIEHALAYGAIESEQLDVTDAYSTDGELTRFDLQLLTDDQQFFPRYNALLLARHDLAEQATQLLGQLNKLIDESTMRALNATVSNNTQTPAQTARQFLIERKVILATENRETVTTKPRTDRLTRIFRNTLVHLQLTGIALGLACLLAIPLALLLFQHQRAAKGLLYVTGLIQTIPSLALLALMIPLFGLGQLPAIAALFLYSLLPIVRNTLAGIFAVDPLLKQVATGMGLTPRQQLLKIELPLAMPMILAGIKTAAIISIGTATLAAFVGAGGLGEPIITGLTLNDHHLILEGAIPAALLAMFVELLFELLERGMVPRHLLSQH